MEIALSSTISLVNTSRPKVRRTIICLTILKSSGRITTIRGREKQGYFMKCLSVLLLFIVMLAGCQNSSSYAQDQKPIVAQRSIADIACGPCAMFNWMSHGGEDLQVILKTLSNDLTPRKTVLQIIETYGKRQSSTNPSVKRYGSHNGGVGSVNLMLMAKELLADHMESPPTLRGEYLQRREEESTEEHLARVVSWFSNSIDSGVPILFYLRCYHRNSDDRKPQMVFGHHVVITALDEEIEETGEGTFRIGFEFVDSSTGRADSGFLKVAEEDFTAPTFTYRFENDRAVTTENIVTGRPLLDVRIPSYASANPPKTRIVTAHFATFADQDD